MSARPYEAARHVRETHLEDGGTLERDEHEPGEQAEPPVLVQTPEGNAEQLEDEERGDGVFREQFGKLGNRDLAQVDPEFRREVVHGSIEREVGLFGRGRAGEQARRLLERSQVGRGVAWVRKLGKGECLVW